MSTMYVLNVVLASLVMSHNTESILSQSPLAGLLQTKHNNNNYLSNCRAKLHNSVPAFNTLRAYWLFPSLSLPVRDLGLFPNKYQIIEKKNNNLGMTNFSE
jgi:hypothetical protein